MNIDEEKEHLIISIAAERLNVHPQTLRLYEKRGLIKPARSKGNTRLYSKENIKRLELILRLTNELGVNLAGVEVIINMRETIKKLEDEKNDLVNQFIRKAKEELAKNKDLKQNTMVKSALNSIIRTYTNEIL